MEGKTYIVTGGSSGIGKAIAAGLCEQGARVIIAGRDADKLESARDELERFPGQVLAVPLDVRNREQVAGMLDQATDSCGKVDGLINNAAGNFIVPAEELSANGWQAVIGIVLHGTWNCTQLVAKRWLASGQPGHIVNILATYAWTGAAGVVHSASAKAAVLAMGRSLAVEWGGRGIRVNGVAPGPIGDTGGASRLFGDEAKRKAMLERIPLGRLGRGEEIAQAVRFLLSPEAAFINGECLTVDGGRWIAGKRFL